MKRSLFFQSMAAMLGILVLSCSSEKDMPTVPKDEAKTSTFIPLEASRADLFSILNDLDKAETRHSFPSPRVIANEFSVSRGVPTRSGAADSVSLHVFNFADNQGYAIMSGDERYPSLIALTESGNIDQYGDNQVNGGVSVFLEGLENIFDNPPLNPRDTLPVEDQEYDTYGPWSQKVIFNSATCNVKWGQDTIYNAVVEEVYGQPFLTGCVATAVAQLMSVHEFPTTYDGHTFNWTEMKRYPCIEWCSPEAQHQIAMLMCQLGFHKNLDVKYGLKESSAKAEKVSPTLSSFGYSSGGSLSVFNSNVLINELKNGFPVLVSGFVERKRIEIAGVKFSYIYSKGHMWLAHGLMERSRKVYHHSKTGLITSYTIETVYYPRYNWGWESTHDGYFLPTVFDARQPSANDYTRGEEEENLNLQYNTQIISGIRK